MSKSREFLGTMPIGKLLLKLAIPNVVAQVVNMLYNIVDRIYIGHMGADGSLALTGIGICTPLIMIITAFALLVSSGGAPRASIALGENDHDRAEKILGGCFSLQILISILLTAVMLIWNRPLLLAFGASPNTIEYASAYMTVYSLGTIFVQLTLGMNAFITAQGFSKTSMLTVVFGAISNIVLDPLFIFVFKMGVQGAALATIISQGVSCIWVLRFLLGNKTALKIKSSNFFGNTKLILKCLALGAASFVMIGSESILFVCFNTSLLKYGGDIAVGAMTILSSVSTLVMMPVQGFTQGAQPIIGFNYGARKPERVKKTFWYMVGVSFCYSIIFVAAVVLFSKSFAAIFTTNPELLEFTSNMLKIYIAGFAIIGLQFSCQMVFVATGKTVCSILVAVVRKFVLLIPLIYILPVLGLPLNQTACVYLAEPVSDVCAVSFTIILFAFQFRKILSNISDKRVYE